VDTQDAEWIGLQSRIHEARFALRCSDTVTWSMNDPTIGWRFPFFALTSGATCVWQLDNNATRHT